MEETVKIAVRWRHTRTIDGKEEKEEEIVVQKLTKNVIGVDEHTFLFDEVIDNSTQNEIYDDLVKPMVDKAVGGFNCTILAYGQTGAGKTYTMGFENNENSEQNGLTMRAIDDLFSRPNADKIKVSLSFIEIYNDRAYDLLSETPAKQSNVKGHKNSISVKKLVQNLAEAQTILASCMKNRRVRQTKMNPNSSRSHGIMTIHVEVQQDEKRTKAAINLVDLAGSEGVRRTSHKGVALLEGNHINQGLLCIAKVIKALSQKHRVIPYRDTVLTTVLQDSLNTRSYLILLACITPFRKDCSQTLSTLRFAAGAKTMKITPQLNTLITEYKKSKTPVKLLNNKFKKTPLTLGKTSKELFKSPLPPHSNFKNRTFSSRVGNFPSSSKQSYWPNQRFSTPATPSSNPTKTIRNIGRSESDSTAKSKAAQNLFQESKMSNISAILSNKDDSFDCIPMNVSTSTVIGQDNMRTMSNKSHELPLGFSYSPILNRVDKLLTERLAPLMNTLQQTALNFKAEETQRQTESIRSIAQQFIEGIPLHQNDVTQNNSENCLIAPPSTPAKDDDIVSIETSTVETQNETVIEKRDEFVKPDAVPILRRSSRLSMRINSTNTDENAFKHPAPRRSRRISVMMERSNIIEKEKPTTKAGKSKKFTFDQDLKEMAKAPRENVKLSHKEFVLNILNTGTMKDLQLLPTIGTKTAYQIYTYRLSNGEFEGIEALKEMPFWKESNYKRFIVQNNL